MSRMRVMRKRSNIFSASCFRHEQGHSMPRQMGLHMLAVKKRRETGLYVPSTCGFRTTKSRQFEQYKISMHKVWRGAHVAGIYGLLCEDGDNTVLFDVSGCVSRRSSKTQ